MEKKRIFMFDDNQQILELCKEIFDDLGLETETSVTTNDVVDKVRNYLPHLIFMDNWLPDVGGIGATQAIKADPELKHIPVIYFSANNDVKALAETAGADTYLPKPFDIQELENVVSRYLNN